jgi:hypothetical protein
MWSTLIAVVLVLASAAPSLGQYAPSPRRGRGRSDSYPQPPPQNQWEWPGSLASEPLVRNPALYREYLRQEIAKDLAKLGALSEELTAALRQGSDRRAASKRAGQIAKLARRTWKNVQYRQPKGEHPANDLKPSPRELAVAQADAERLRALVVDVAAKAAQRQRSAAVSADEQADTVGKLEQIEVLARRVEADLARLH